MNTYALFASFLINTGRIASLFSFENEEFIFPSVHHAFRFALLTLRSEQRGLNPEFVFFARQPDQIKDDLRRFSLSADDIARINPNTRTAPVFRSRTDTELTAKIYSAVPVLIDDTKGKDGNPWGVSFMAMFHMANDSGLFQTATQLREAGFEREHTDWVAPKGLKPRQGILSLAGGHDLESLPLQDAEQGHVADRYVPLYEAKMIHQFDHRWAAYDADGESRDVTLFEKADVRFEIEPRYWLPQSEIKTRLATKGWKRDWLMGWRRISGVEKIRTVIASAMPAAGPGDSIFLVLPSGELPAEVICCLLSCFSSISFDFIARTKMGGTNLSYYIMQQLPVLPPSFYTQDNLNFLVPRILELTYTSCSIKPFARDLGYGGPPFTWDEDRRARLRAELDAWYARAYGLTRDELRYILDPADVKGPDYPSETFRVLKANEIKRFGEYRTARLVLEAWDRSECGELAMA